MFKTVVAGLRFMLVVLVSYSSPTAFVRTVVVNREESQLVMDCRDRDCATTVLNCVTTPARFQYDSVTIYHDCIHADSSTTHHDVSRPYHNTTTIAHGCATIHDFTCQPYIKGTAFCQVQIIIILLLNVCTSR